MATRFLTEEWAAALTDALNSSEDFQRAAGRHEVRLQQVVTAVPDGSDAKYYFTLKDGTAEVSLGELSDPEATITQDYETAVAISKGELGAQNAFMQGRLKISGNMMKLMQLQGLISTIPKAVSGLEVDY